MPEQVRTDLALLEIVEDDAVHAPPQHLGEMVLPQVQRQRPEIVARAHQDVEGVELASSSCLRLCRPLKSAIPSTPSSTASPSRTKEPGL